MRRTDRSASQCVANSPSAVASLALARGTRRLPMTIAISASEKGRPCPRANGFRSGDVARKNKTRGNAQGPTRYGLAMAMNTMTMLRMLMMMMMAMPVFDPRADALVNDSKGQCF